MRSWFAAHWTPDDLPGLRRVAQLYDLCERYADDPFIETETRKGDVVYIPRPHPAAELRQMMDNYGITPKGQQDRRWVRPKADAKPGTRSGAKAAKADAPYGHLRVVGQ